jgi:hypothetical protein
MASLLRMDLGERIANAMWLPWGSTVCHNHNLRHLDEAADRALDTGTIR